MDRDAERRLMEAQQSTERALQTADDRRRERDAMIRAALADGMSQAEIARLLGLTTARLAQIASDEERGTTMDGNYALQLRWGDSRWTRSRAEHLEGAWWHIDRGVVLRRRPLLEERPTPAVRGMPIVDVGTGPEGRRLVLFGEVNADRWESWNDEGDPPRRYKRALAVTFEPVVFELRPDSRLRPQRAKRLSYDGYQAWRDAVRPLDVGNGGDGMPPTVAGMVDDELLDQFPGSTVEHP
jgi:hypothetical protein